MTTVAILIFHILCAVVAIGYACGTLAASANRNIPLADKRVRGMWLGTGATMASGTVLAFVTGATIQHTCVSFAIFLALSLAAHRYQRTIRQKIYRA